MRRTSGLQKVLYLIIFCLAIYILYKLGCIAVNNAAAQRALEAGEVQRKLEDAAMRTYMPGYTATVEGRESPDWLTGWMRELVPVYSYLAEGRDSTESSEETAGTGEAERETAAAQNPSGEVPAETAADKQSTGDLPDANGRSEKSGTDGETSEAHSLVSGELLGRLEDFSYLLGHYYTVDAGTAADAQLLDADRLLGEDLRLVQNPEVPQILIYHTHSQEAFADSEEGVIEDSIVGMGEALARELRDTYGYNVIHDTGVYDLVDGVLDRSAAYDYAREAVERILQENPTIEVVIDLHRDGVDGQKFVTEIDGKPTSMIMFFNGISRDSQDQPLSWLQNPWLPQNLAFSFQMQLAAQKLYPGFTRNIYLKAERFNLHLRPRSLLIEAGTQMNTVEEERNAMEPIAALLHCVLSGA